MKGKTMNAPELRVDGSCPDCQGGWLCLFHQAGTQRRFVARETALKLAAIGARQARIARICAQHELESDEFYTAEQKAERLI